MIKGDESIARYSKQGTTRSALYVVRIDRARAEKCPIVIQGGVQPGVWRITKKKGEETERGIAARVGEFSRSRGIAGRIGKWSVEGMHMHAIPPDDNNGMGSVSIEYVACEKPDGSVPK